MRRNRKVEERTSKLAASERSVREMVANISHNLKTPMSVLSANLEVALEAEALPEVRRHLKGGAITVSAGEMAGGFVAVSISDTGEGIEPGLLPYIFERYYKGDRARGAEGAGLGLYIVKTAVEAMGGSVSAESAVGKGTKITFTLKAKDSPQENAVL